MHSNTVKFITHLRHATQGRTMQHKQAKYSNRVRHGPGGPIRPGRAVKSQIKLGRARPGWVITWPGRVCAVSRAVTTLETGISSHLKSDPFTTFLRRLQLITNSHISQFTRILTPSAYIYLGPLSVSVSGTASNVTLPSSAFVFLSVGTLHVCHVV